MKKCRTMRLASAMLVLTLLSTCMISGTFAKYTTKTTANDTARVAKWGVKVSASNELFVTDYEVHDTASGFGYSSDYSVEAALNTDNSRDDIIAPGTSGKMNFSITGTPEVAVNVKVDFNTTPNSLKMVTIPTATGYTDYTEATYATDATTTAYNKTFDLAKDYNPVVWTLKRSNTIMTDFTSVAPVVTGNLQAIQEYFTDTTKGLNKNYDPNKTLEEVFGYYELSWTWPYNGNDAADTYLGNVIAGVKTDDTVKTTEAFDFSIVVTQID